MAEKHIYTVNLNKAKAVPRHKRTGRAMRIVKEYVRKHSKTDTVRVSNALNEYMWQDSAQNPPNKVSVQVIEDDGVAHVERADLDFELPDEAEDEEPAETAVSGGDLDDEEIAELNVDEVKDLVREDQVEAQRALDIEYAGKNRKTLIEWLENRLDEDSDESSEDTASQEEEAAEESEETGETYDLPDDVVETFENGSIDDGKEAAKELGTSEFEKLLNFEEAHKNRKGMKQWLRSNMN